MDGSDFAFDLRKVQLSLCGFQRALEQVAATKEDVLEGEAIAAPMPEVFRLYVLKG